jgi:hypothetical protein
MKIGGVEFRSLKKEMRLKRWEKVIMYFYMGELRINLCTQDGKDGV